MKKAVWFLSFVGMIVATEASANGHIFLQSGNKQVNMVYEAPVNVASEDEINDTINRLVATNSRKTSYSQDYANTSSSASSAPTIAAQVASRAAHAKSIGRCAHYVRKALQAAGYKFTPQASAYMYANGTLSGAGFVKISSDNYQPQVGDVVVFNRTSRNPHGHIQIYDGGQWVSDFRQPNFSPYRNHNGYSVWRDAKLVNGNGGTYLALND